LKHLTDCGELLTFASNANKADATIVMKAVTQSGDALEYASTALRDNKSIVEAAVKNSPMAIAYASEKWKGNKALVLMAVKQQGLAIQFASNSLKDDVDVVSAAVSNAGYNAYNNASKRLKDDDYIKKIKDEFNGWHTQFDYSTIRPLNDPILPILGLTWTIERFCPIGFAFTSECRNVIAFIEKSDELALYRLTTGEFLSNIELLGAFFLGSESDRYSYDYFDNVSARVSATADNTILATRGRQNRVLFYEVLWSSDNGSASARKLQHEYKGSAQISTIKFSPDTLNTRDAPEYLLALGKMTGETELVRVSA
jgi:hypothetical protein